MGWVPVQGCVSCRVGGLGDAKCYLSHCTVNIPETCHPSVHRHGERTAEASSLPKAVGHQAKA